MFGAVSRVVILNLVGVCIGRGWHNWGSGRGNGNTLLVIPTYTSVGIT